MRFLQLADRIAVSGHVSPWTFADAINFQRRSRRPGHAHTVSTGDRSSIRHPEISGSAFDNLKFHRPRPNLLLTLHVIQNTAITRLPIPWSVRAFAPLELGAQIVIRKFLLRNDVPEFFPRNMNGPVFDPKDLIRIVIEPVLLQENIEVCQVVPVEQDHRLAARWNVALSATGKCSR